MQGTELSMMPLLNVQFPTREISKRLSHFGYLNREAKLSRSCFLASLRDDGREGSRMGKEANLRVCKKCNETKMRIQDGKYPNGKNKRWRDESGKEWSGNVCGSCNVDRAKEVKRRGSNE
jgi:hypothetical protein